MVKTTSSKSKGDKEVTVVKPKEKPVISSQPLEKEELDLTKLKDSIVSELKPPVELYESKDTTKPRKRRQKKQLSINQNGKTKESPIILESQKVATGRSNGFYVGIAIGILVGTLGIYYLYNKYRESRLNSSSEESLIKELEAEGIKDIENRRYT